MIRAEVDLSFFRRFLWIAIGCVLGTAWCLLDAWVTYPRKLVIAESYESFPQTDAGLEQWQAVSEKNGWLAEPPEKTASELRALILNQYILMTGCIVVGIIMFLKWLLPRGSWIEGNKEEIRNSRGQNYSLDSLVGIDRRRWEQKGIAVLHFLDGNKTQKFVLDDFKYNREAIGDILKLAEERLEELIEDTGESNVVASPQDSTTEDPSSY